ncbi:hypothetical protein [Variovorax paradoxus]|jgi:hypothetical protein|uniref:hypothetical protein n=1 Tax=Variovorax paradoxus TaxID=34073 RepID=UPI000B0D8552
MSSLNNIATLRDALFAQLQELSDTDKPVDIARHRLRNEVAQTIIATAKVEVELAAVLKGALEVPFIENQSDERPADVPALPKTPMEKAAEVLSRGPSPDHAWRKRICGPQRPTAASSRGIE